MNLKGVHHFKEYAFWLYNMKLTASSQLGVIYFIYTKSYILSAKLQLHGCWLYPYVYHTEIRVVLNFPSKSQQAQSLTRCPGSILYSTKCFLKENETGFLLQPAKTCNRNLLEINEEKHQHLQTIRKRDCNHVNHSLISL